MEERQRLSARPSNFNWLYLTPIAWAPAFPLLRLGLAKVPVHQRHWALGAAIFLANVHAIWLINQPDLREL